MDDRIDALAEGDDAFGISRINFDGWRYLGFPLPGNYPGEGFGWPANSQWKSDKENVVHYPLTLTKLEDGTATTFRAIIPRGAVAIKPDSVQLTFIVNRTMTPHDGNATSQDFRQLALALSGVWYYPLHDVRLPLGSLPVGEGWTPPVFAASEANIRWMNANEARLTLSLPTGEPLAIALDQAQTPDADTAKSLMLAVNGVPVPLKPSDVRGRTIMNGLIAKVPIGSKSFCGSYGSFLLGLVIECVSAVATSSV